MTANKRIFLNIVATYGRSLFALVCGLFTARWVLMALGQQDYGLYGVVGGLTAFIGMINMLLSVALNRYYAVSVGALNVAKDKAVALTECRKWFSTAVFIHAVIPMLLMLIGYPIGIYVIEHGWIFVPSDRLVACLWVFRFACLSCLVGMMTVPYYAMYTAKQYIAELTIYSLVTTSLGIFFFYYMATHPAVWLAKYAAWMSVMSVVPNIIIALRARFLFPECRLLIRDMLCWHRVRHLVGFASWQAFGGLGNLCRWQGIAILLNRHVEFGSMRNSSMTVANQVASSTDMLASSMMGAFQPAIANEFGAGNRDRMISLAYCCCKVGTLFSLLFMLPLSLELPMVMSIWLKDPPQYAVGLCFTVLLAHVIDRTSAGHMLAVNATGKIAAYQAFLGSALIMSLPLAWAFLRMRLGIYAVGWAFVISTTLCAWGRVWFARKIAGMSARYWLLRIVLPLFFVSLIVLLVGALPRFFMNQTIHRVIVTTVLSEGALFMCSWLILLDENEKNYVVERLTRMYSKRRMRND